MTTPHDSVRKIRILYLFVISFDRISLSDSISPSLMELRCVHYLRPEAFLLFQVFAVFDTTVFFEFMSILNVVPITGNAITTTCSIVLVIFIAHRVPFSTVILCTHFLLSRDALRVHSSDSHLMRLEIIFLRISSILQQRICRRRRCGCIAFRNNDICR